ncbi:MAG: hypothetical protein ACFHU9_05115 [Fluviicola sp.]
MNLRNFSKEHAIGMLFGILTPIFVMPLVLYLWATWQGYTFDRMWYDFKYFSDPRIKIITLSIIGNLFWFYRFLNKENWKRAMGVILGSMAYAPYIVYIKFFA